MLFLTLYTYLQRNLATWKFSMQVVELWKVVLFKSLWKIMGFFKLPIGFQRQLERIEQALILEWRAILAWNKVKMKDLKFVGTFVGTNLFHRPSSLLWRCEPFQRQNQMWLSSLSKAIDLVGHGVAINTMMKMLLVQQP